MTLDARSYLVAALAVALFTVPAQAQHNRPRDLADRSAGGGDCDRNGDRDGRYRVCVDQTMGWRANGRTLAVDAGPNGGVTVTGWDRDSVHVAYTIHAASRTSDEAARELAGRVRVRNDDGVISAVGPGSSHGASWWVSYDVSVPRSSDLTLESRNGPVGVYDVSGRMELTVRNGPLTLDNVGGAVRARAQNGPLSVSLSGSQWQGEYLDAETHNGPVVLAVPNDYNAVLETGTVNGPMEFGFPITVQGRFGGGRGMPLTTTLGRGGPRVRAVTTNGPAIIRRAGAR